MKLNKQIVSVTLASTMILSSTSMITATNFDSNDKEIAVKGPVETKLKKQSSEKLNKIISAVEKAEKTSIQANIDIAKELIVSLAESETKEILVSRLKSLEESINKVEADKAEVIALMEIVEAVPASEDLTVEHKPKVEKAIDTYSNLTEEQKDSIEAESFDKLLKAEDIVNKLEENQAKELEELKQVMSSIERAESTKSQDDTDVAKGLIDSLTESETKNSLTDRLVSTQESINKVEIDKKEANILIEQINNIPVSKDLNIEHKIKVKETINAYNNLTEGQKGLVESKYVNKLLVAEDIVNKLEEKVNTEAADRVSKLINSLNKSVKVEDVTEKYITKADEVREAYNDLNDNAKSLVSESNVEKLERVKDNVTKSKASVKSVQDKIKALPKDNDILGNGESVLEAKKAYDDLSYTAKRFISKESKSLLNKKVKKFKLFTKEYFPGLNRAIYEEDDLNKKQQLLNISKTNLSIAKGLEINEAKIDYYEKTIDKAERQIKKSKQKSDKIAALDVDKLIAELSNTDSISQEFIIKTETIRKAYNNLNNNAKIKVSQSNIGKLKEIEDKVSKIKVSVKSVEDNIKVLPENKDILRHGKAILKTKNTYDGLSDEVKDLINEELKSSLNEAIESFKSFNKNEFSSLSQVVSRESDLKKKQQLINLAQGNFDLVKELAIDQIDENHYQNMIIEAQKQVNAINVRILINDFDENLNTEDITEEYISKVKAAKRAYDALSPGAKAFIDAFHVEKLERTNDKIDEAKEIAIANTNKLIASISETDTISKQLVNEIEAAQNSYNALNNDSKALVAEDNIEKLKGLENVKAKIAELKKSVKPVEDRISLLPENKNILGYGKSILRAQDQYDALPGITKILVSEDSQSILNGALEDYKSFTKLNISDLNKSVSKEIDLDKKQELVNISQRSLDLSKQLGIDESEIKESQNMIDEAQKQVNDVNEEVSAKGVANKVDKLVSRFDETVHLEDMTEDYISKVKIASKAYNALSVNAKALVSNASVKKLVRVETKLYNMKSIVKSIEDKISVLSEDKDILSNYETILETKESYNDLSDTAKNFIKKDLKLSLNKTVENFKRLTTNGIEELQESISNAQTLKAKRSIVNKAPFKLERVKALGMEEDEYDQYKSMIEASDNIVSDLEDKAVQLKEATIEAQNAVENLSKDITIQDKQEINMTRVLVNKVLSLDSNVKISGIEKLNSAEMEYKNLKKQSILTTIESLNEENTEEEIKSMLQLLEDTTSEFDMNTVKDKSLSRYLDNFRESTIKSDKDVQALISDVNETVAKLEEAMLKAESAIFNLPTLENIKAEDKMKVVNAKALIESVKVFDENATVKDQEKIAGLDARVDELEQAKKVEDKINNLAALDKFTLENKPEAEEALEEYKDLTIYQQSLVGNIDDLFSVKSELEEESDKSEEAIEAITKAKKSNSEKDIGMAKALINTLSQDEDKEALASKLNVVEKQIDKTEDEKTIAQVKSDLKFATQISDTIVKPRDIDGISFILDVSNVKGVGLVRDAEIDSDGNLNITRELTTSTSFDMMVTIQKGDAKDTKVFNVVAEGDLWPGNSVTTIKAQD